MKQKDVAVILIVVFVAAFASFFASKLLFSSSKIGTLEVEKVDAITTEFNSPNKKYFNEDSLNPSQDVLVTDNNNTNPFGN